MSFMSYLTSELTRGYKLERDEAKYSEKRERVYSFMKTPRALEKFLLYGFFQCADAFLYIFTFLPLRILLAFVRLLTHPCGFVSSRRAIEQAQICDILKGLILIASATALTYIDISMLYHIIRGQSVIKLYIFYNMLELADKLFSTFGQDILDSLFWTATEPRDRKREHFGVIPHLALAVIYVLLHSILFLLQMTTLSVAFNSHNKSLLTIMMSNNFVEIKSNVFRRMDKHNLFQMTCSDAKERFYYVILLFLVLMRNMTEFSWNLDHFWVVIPDAMLLLFAEVLVDWFKHAFVTKFNDINSDVYHEFTVSLAKDITANRQKSAFTDQTDLVSRRMTFTPLPLACLVIRMCSKTVRVTGVISVITVIIGYFCLMSLKIITSISLLGQAAYLTKERRQNAEESHSTVDAKTHSQNSTVNSSDCPKSSDDRTSVTAHAVADRQPTAVVKRFSLDGHCDDLNDMAMLSSSSVSLNSLTLHEDVGDRPATQSVVDNLEAINARLRASVVKDLVDPWQTGSTAVESNESDEGRAAVVSAQERGMNRLKSESSQAIYQSFQEDGEEGEGVSEVRGSSLDQGDLPGLTYRHTSTNSL